MEIFIIKINGQGRGVDTVGSSCILVELLSYLEFRLLLSTFYDAGRLHEEEGESGSSILLTEVIALFLSTPGPAEAACVHEGNLDLESSEGPSSSRSDASHPPVVSPPAVDPDVGDGHISYKGIWCRNSGLTMGRTVDGSD